MEFTMNSLTHDEMTLASIYALDHNTRLSCEALKTMRGYLAQMAERGR